MKPDANDLLALAGVALATVGIACWSIPGALVALGVVLALAGVLPRLPRRGPR